MRSLRRLEDDLARETRLLDDLYSKKLAEYIEMHGEIQDVEKGSRERQLNSIEFMKEQKLRNLEKVRRIRRESPAYSMGLKLIEVGLPVLGVLGAAYLKERRGRGRGNGQDPA